MARYLSSRHPHLWIADRCTVLNRGQDKYSVLAPARAAALLGVSVGWHVCAVSNPLRDPPTQTFDELVRGLLDQNPLAVDHLRAEVSTRVTIDLAATALALPMGRMLRVHTGHSDSTVAAERILSTAASRLAPLATVRGARERRARGVKRRTFYAKRALNLAMDCSFIKPNFCSTADACLRDSLAPVLSDSVKHVRKFTPTFAV